MLQISNSVNNQTSCKLPNVNFMRTVFLVFVSTNCLAPNTSAMFRISCEQDQCISQFKTPMFLSNAINQYHHHSVNQSNRYGNSVAELVCPSCTVYLVISVQYARAEITVCD